MEETKQILEINHDYILNRIKSRFPDQVLDFYIPYDLLTITVTKDILVDLFTFLRDDDVLRFDFLTDLCGIHYPNNTDNEIGVVYHLHSFLHNIRLRVKSYADKLNPVFPTMTGLYSSANWMERETYDFYGVKFSGHPDLRRILNMDEMNYFPLRKEYPLQDATRTDKEDKYFGR